jgi:hypothetical protein
MITERRSACDVEVDAVAEMFELGSDALGADGARALRRSLGSRCAFFGGAFLLRCDVSGPAREANPIEKSYRIGNC